MIALAIGQKAEIIESGTVFDIAGIDGDCVMRGEDGAWFAVGDLIVTTPVETYRGVSIEHRHDDGYAGSLSCAIHFGYCDTLQALRDEIDGHFADEAEFYGDRRPIDTPTLDNSFHDNEMDVA